MKAKDFEKSQKAHIRLSRFYGSKENMKSRRLSSYHWEVFNRQEVKGSILSREAKRNIFKAWHPSK